MQTRFPSLREEYTAMEEALKSKAGMENYVRKFDNGYKTLKQDAYTIIIRETGQKILICRECGSNNHEILNVNDYHDCKNLIVEVQEDNEYFDCPVCGGPPTIDVEIVNAVCQKCDGEYGCHNVPDCDGKFENVVICKKCRNILKRSWRPFTVTQCGCAGPEHGRRKQ
jgi:hypothetical protein